jgi:hypothetical protein
MDEDIVELNAGDEALADHLRGLEESLLDPGVRRDRARVAALLADDFLEFGSSGRVWTREETLRLLATESYTYTRPEMVDFACRRMAHGVALVTYKTIRVEAATGERAEALRSSLWTEKSGTWQVRFHQGTRIGNEDREGKLKL